MRAADGRREPGPTADNQDPLSRARACARTCLCRHRLLATPPPPLSADLRVVVTSATLETQKFATYFNDCPVLVVEGRTYPVDIYHARSRVKFTHRKALVEAVVRRRGGGARRGAVASTDVCGWPCMAPLRSVKAAGHGMVVPRHRLCGDACNACHFPRWISRTRPRPYPILLTARRPSPPLTACPGCCCGCCCYCCVCGGGGGRFASCCASTRRRMTGTCWCS